MNTRLHVAILFTAVLFCCSNLHAQKSKWGTFTYGGQHVDVVTVSQPDVRHACHVKRLTDDELICSHPMVRYAREDVAAVIEPPSHNSLRTGLLIAALSAAAIAGSVFVPVTGVAVLLQVTGGIGMFGSIVDWIDGCSEDHDDDILKYQKDGVPLGVALQYGR